MNSIGEVAQLIAALVLAFNCWQAWNNGRNAKKIGDEVTLIKEQTDGISAKLVKVTGEAEHAKGVLQGALQEQAKVSGDPVKVEIVKIPPINQP